MQKVVQNQTDKRIKIKAENDTLLMLAPLETRIVQEDELSLFKLESSV